MELVLLGAGGHAKVVAGIARRCGYTVAGFLDDGRPEGSLFQGARVLGPISQAALRTEALFVAVGDNAARQRLFQSLETREFVTLIDPHAVVPGDLQIGRGSVVMPGAVVLAGTTIGSNCILNTSCSVGICCNIADHAHLCPGTCLEQGAAVGEGTMLGTGSIVLRGVRVGERCVVGAGAILDADLAPGLLAYGRPLQSKAR